jgi:hypothetical protein
VIRHDMAALTSKPSWVLLLSVKETLLLTAALIRTVTANNFLSVKVATNQGMRSEIYYIIF